MSHDQNFKNLILDYPRQALQFFAADEAAHIDERVTILAAHGFSVFRGRSSRPWARRGDES